MSEDIEEKVTTAQDGAPVDEKSGTGYELSGRVFAQDSSASPRHYTLEDAYRATIQMNARYEGG